MFPQTVDGLLDPVLEPVSDTQYKATGLPSSVNPSAVCPVYLEKGECRVGLKCRFLGGHVKKGENGSPHLLKDEEKIVQNKDRSTELNFLKGEALKLLRTKNVCTPRTTLSCN